MSYRKKRNPQYQIRARPRPLFRYNPYGEIETKIKASGEVKVLTDYGPKFVPRYWDENQGYMEDELVLNPLLKMSPNWFFRIRPSTVKGRSGAYVDIPEEHWQEFKDSFPKSAMPKKTMVWDIGPDSPVLLLYWNKFYRMFPRSHGVIYSPYFSESGKGWKILEDFYSSHKIPMRGVGE